MIKNNFVMVLSNYNKFNPFLFLTRKLTLWIICYYRELYGLVNGEIGSEFSKDFLICLFLYLLN